MGNNETISFATNKTINELGQDLDSSFSKAHLAELRNSIGKDSFPIMSMSSIYRHLPDRYLSNSGKLTYGENSLLMSLQLYSIHQQGQENNVCINDKKENLNVGASLNKYRNKKISEEGNSESFDKRFNAMITSNDTQELFNHLRHLIKIAKKDIVVDYGQLSQDLYYFQLGYQNEIRLKWSRQYYRFNNKQEEKGE